MIFLRALIFNIMFYGITAVMSIIGLPLLLLPHGAIVFYGRLWGKILIALLRHIVGLRHRVIGAIPAGRQVIYAAKHQSAWETIVLYDILAAPAPVLKRALNFIPLVGLYFMKAPSVAIDRSAGMRALKRLEREARREVSCGRNILIFPQGTRVAPGREHPYHAGTFALYRATGLPVVPVALNSGLFWGRAAFMKKPGEITVQLLNEIPPGLGRKQFMARLEDAIESASKALHDMATG